MHLFKDLTRLAAGLGGIALSMAVAGQALAQELPFLGEPHDGGMNFQTPATSIAEETLWIDTAVLYLITGITLLVCVLVAWVIIFHNRRANPTPARFTHNSPLEVVWTIVPIFILIAIGSFTVPALFRSQIMPEADVTIKVTGYQWYWGYEYVDHGVEFSSYLLQRDELAEFGYEPRHYLLATDTQVVVPVGQNVVMQVTGSDVIHSWALPAFGVKQDAVPGRLAQLWFNVDPPGIYFGQCSELCGNGHAYMPIVVRAVPEADYIAWLQEQGATNLAAAPGYDATVQLAAASE
ncbi:cytochrome c oxidase subunit II [Pararhodobacter sp.]|uniref:cytochrome c oxidase subunit II n=1 Tax=Pararhodobacter sp. TaxID=2127056 RepID=UPI002B002169|nr:cytochrome c oxidase subunit II [Pararhodobacter sp.]